MDPRCPIYAPFFGAMGCSIAMIFANIGAAYGMAKCSVAISSVGVLHPEGVIRNLIPVILSSVLAIYGLCVSVLISTSLKEKSALFTNFLYLGAGMSVGISALAAGFSIGIIGDAGVRGVALQPRLYMGWMLILIFAEVLGIYGFIVSLLMITQSSAGDVTKCY